MRHLLLVQRIAALDCGAKGAQDGRVKLIVLVLVVASGCASLRVEHVNNATLVSSTALLLCDSMQTIKIAGQGWPDGRSEGNPIMAGYPGPATVAAYGLATVLANWVLWRVAPRKYRWIVPSTLTVTQARQVQTNEQRGTGWCGFGGTAKIASPDEMAGRR